MTLPTSITDLLDSSVIKPYRESLGVELGRISPDFLRGEKGRILVGLKERGYEDVAELMEKVVESVKEGEGISEPRIAETIAYMLTAEVEGMGQKVREEQASMGRG